MLSAHGLVVVAATGVMLNPSSAARVAVLLVAALAELAEDLPDPWNHTTLLGILGLTVLLWWTATAVRRRAPLPTSALLDGVAPFLRLSFVVVWAAAAFAKLNDGFVTAPASCAVWMAHKIPGLQLPAEFDRLEIVAATSIELAVPVLLFVRRTRVAGVALGWGFHLFAALAGHTAFSGIAWSFYVLFLSPEVVEDVLRRANRATTLLHAGWRRTIATSRRTPLAWLFAGLAAAAVVALVRAIPASSGGRVQRWGTALPYAVWASGWAVLLVRSWRKIGWRRAAVSRPMLPRHPVLVAGVLLLIINASSPYLGLKTRYSFTMYSNLRTEPGYWNHHLLPEAVRVFHWQDNPVVVQSVASPQLTRILGLEDGPVAVPAMELRALAADHEDIAITYLSAGREVTTHLGDDPLFSKPLGFLEQRLVNLRPIPAEPACQV